jgi:WD40 repeat protein
MIPAVGIGSGRVQSLSFSPDSRSLAVLTNIGFKILDVPSGRVLNSVHRYSQARPWSWQNPQIAICWSPDGKRIALASHEIEIWNPVGKTPERTLPLNGETLSDLVWSPSGDKIAAQSDESRIMLIDTTSGRRVEVPERLKVFTTRGPSWSPDGRFLAILVDKIDNTSESEAVHVWDVSHLVLVREIPLVGLQKLGHGQTTIGFEQSVFVRDPSLVAWAPDGKVIAVDSGETGLSLWDARTGRFLRQLSQGNRFLSWSREGTTVYVQADHQIRSVNRRDGTAVVVTKNVVPNDEPIVLGQAVVSLDGRYIAAVVDTRQPDEVDLWQVGRQRPVFQTPWRDGLHIENYAEGFENGRSGSLIQRQISPDGRQLVVSGNGATEIVDSESGRRVFGPLPEGVWIAWSGSGKLILVGHHAGVGETRLIRASDGQQLSSFKPSGFISLSPNEDLVAMAGSDGVQVIRVSDGAVVETIKDVLERPPRLPQYMHRYVFASWSPNGRKILLEESRDKAIDLQPAVFSLEDRTLKPAPPGTGRLLWVGPEELVRTPIPSESLIVQSPNLQLAVALPETPAISQVWDLRAGKIIDGPVVSRVVGRAAVWSPDSTRLAYVTLPGEIDVWDVAAGKVKERWLAPHAEGATVLRWPERLTLVENMEGALRVWRQP